MKLFSFSIIVLCVLAGCKKSDNPAPPPPAPGSCLLIKETTSLIGNEATLEYSYDNTGNLLKRRRINKYNQVRDSLIVTSGDVTIFHQDGAHVRIAYLKSGEDQPVNLYTTLPGRGKVYVKLAGSTTETYYCLYTFHYDAQNRVKQVVMDYIAPGAYDLTMSITYDDKNNATQLNFVRTTGPTDPIPTYVCTSYDDKLSPGAAVKNWPFLNAQNWSYPETIFADLSAHNPYAYVYGQDDIAKTYQYNEKGFAIVQSNKTKTSTTTYTYNRTFTYNCP